MNDTNAPNPTAVSSENDSALDSPRTIDQADLEMACVDLICHLESIVAVAKEMGREEHMKEGSDTANKILAKLLTFSDEFLTGDEASQTREEIVKALDESSVYTAVQKTRSWGSALKRTFGGAEDNENIKVAYESLGLALIRACATVLYHAIVVIGFESPLGKQVDQSTVVFVRELKESW